MDHSFGDYSLQSEDSIAFKGIVVKQNYHDRKRISRQPGDKEEIVQETGMPLVIYMVLPLSFYHHPTILSNFASTN